MTQTATRDRRIDARTTGTYDVYIEIDIDCEELVDACGLTYDRTEHDDTQNEIMIPLSEDEFTDVFEQAPLAITNECTIATALLNYELGECCTRVEALMPSGDTIIFK